MRVGVSEGEGVGVGVSGGEGSDVEERMGRGGDPRPLPDFDTTSLLSSLVSADPSPQKALGERAAILNQFFTPPASCRGKLKGLSASSSKDEPAGATKGRPWTRAAAVEL